MLRFFRYLLRLEKANSLQAVKGTRGYWHGTYGKWGYGRLFGLRTLCYEVISPQKRQLDAGTARMIINCPRCLERLAR